MASRMDYDKLNPPALAATAHFQRERVGRHFGVPVVDSAGSGCARDLWLTVGGSDEGFRNAQDTDFSLRVARDTAARPHFCEEATYHARLRDGVAAAYRRGVRRGTADVQLFRVHGDTFHVAADSPVLFAARWVRLAFQMPWLLSSGRRVLWAENLGRRVGRVRASVTHRTWFP